MRIPKIAAYHKATLKLTALMAKKEGIDREVIQLIVNEADSNIMSDDGKRFEKQIFS